METWTHYEIIFNAMLTAMHILLSIYLLVIYISTRLNFVLNTQILELGPFEMRLKFRWECMVPKNEDRTLFKQLSFELLD